MCSLIHKYHNQPMQMLFIENFIDTHKFKKSHYFFLVFFSSHSLLNICTISDPVSFSALNTAKCPSTANTKKNNVNIQPVIHNTCMNVRSRAFNPRYQRVTQWIKCGQIVP